MCEQIRELRHKEDTAKESKCHSGNSTLSYAYHPQILSCHSAQSRRMVCPCITLPLQAHPIGTLLARRPLL